MNLNFKSFGTGPALIILHGLFGSLDNWQTLARRFADRYSVYVIDQRNHGKSPHSDIMNYPAMAEDLGEFMDQQGITIANLLGHSMGAKTVMQFGNMFPERILKMIVADMSPGRYPATHAAILDALRDFPFGQIRDRKEAEAWLRPKIADSGTLQFILKNLDKAEAGFQWKFNFPAIDYNYDLIREAIPDEGPAGFPVLFVRGGKSDYVKDEHMNLIRSMYPNVELRTIAGAGHWIHAEKPDEFAAEVMKFLNP